MSAPAPWVGSPDGPTAGPAHRIEVIPPAPSRSEVGGWASAGEACPRCGRLHPARIRFCPACGLQLDTAAGAAGDKKQAPGAITEGSARLVLLRGMGSSGTTFPLRAAQTQVGRSSGTLRFATDDTLSPLAATFAYRNGRLFVQDERGPSGVFIRLAAPAILAEGDDFSIGDKLLRFLGKVPAMAPASSGSTRLLGSVRNGNGPLLRLQVLHLGGIPGRIFARPGPLRIGRALGDILFGDDPFVSARHCELELDPAGALLRDLGSSNGTFLRLPPGRERELHLGDTFRLGRSIFRVE